MPKVIYLTGAPAAGKSSMTALLMERVPDMMIWEYGSRLTEHIMARSAGVENQDDLRIRSAGVVSPNDVAEVDRALLDFVKASRADHHVIVDSHPVTKEAYGYRITPFSLAQFGQLGPDEIWVLYTSPAETRQRILADSGGRPLVTEEEAEMHTALQASVAATYGMSIGCPVYLFDTSVPREQLVELLAGRLL
jgi:adenylate kinase